jgi:RNA polymerase sigma factor (sigma-70 family)
MYMNGKNITFIDRNNLCVKMILKGISKYSPLTTEEEYELWRRMRQGDNNARTRLIMSNLGYVMSVAKSYSIYKASLEDLFQAGALGLCKAVDKFDASLGFRLTSYATWFIEGEIRNEAVGYLKHHSDYDSLDEPAFLDEEDSVSKSALLPSAPDMLPDWKLRCNDALLALKIRLDDRQVGDGAMLEDMVAMLQKGYTTFDFARKYKLSDKQMAYFLEKVLTESRDVFRTAA